MEGGRERGRDRNLISEQSLRSEGKGGLSVDELTVLFPKTHTHNYTPQVAVGTLIGYDVLK